MATEIEKKFLVDATKLGSLENGFPIKQAYVTTTDTTTVRVRLKADRAYLCLKGASQGITRSEFEYEIPVPDAEAMMQTFCHEAVVEKTRYLIPYAGHTWELDVFHGRNQGLIVAEIELEHEDELFERPPWLALDVSDQAKYYNVNLLDSPFQNWRE